MFVNNIKLKCFLFKNKYCDEVFNSNKKFVTHIPDKMTGFLRLLVVFCAVSKLSAQRLNASEEEKNARTNLFKVFSE